MTGGLVDIGPHWCVPCRWRKRGLATTGTKFGISFTTKFLNQVCGSSRFCPWQGPCIPWQMEECSRGSRRHLMRLLRWLMFRVSQRSCILTHPHLTTSLNTDRTKRSVIPQHCPVEVPCAISRRPGFSPRCCCFTDTRRLINPHTPNSLGQLKPCPPHCTRHPHSPAPLSCCDLETLTLPCCPFS